MLALLYAMALTVADVALAVFRTVRTGVLAVVGLVFEHPGPVLLLAAAAAAVALELARPDRYTPPTREEN